MIQRCKPFLYPWDFDDDDIPDPDGLRSGFYELLQEIAGNALISVSESNRLCRPKVTLGKRDIGALILRMASIEDEVLARLTEISKRYHDRIAEELAEEIGPIEETGPITDAYSQVNLNVSKAIASMTCKLLNAAIAIKKPIE
jgi:hypothetical protein